MTEGVIFKRLQIAGWRQFASVEIDFHDRLTVLTGANGAGKSTLLNIVARHLGTERQYLGVPKRDKEGKIYHISGRLLSKNWWQQLFGKKNWTGSPDQVGEVEYSTNQKSTLTVPEQVDLQYQLNIPQQQNLFGIVIGSHRLLSQYQAVPNIPFGGIPPEDAFSSFQNIAHQRYLGHNTGQSLMFQIKQALAAWAAVGEGNSVWQAIPVQRQAYVGFVDMLRKILPDTLGFVDLAIRPPDVLLVTKSGEFVIDAASGGITALIEIGALVYGVSIRPDLKGKKFVVAWDEPENHLHPQIQRTLFQSLTKAFPTVQFIVATHSPFIVSSMKESHVYVLRYRGIQGGEPTDQSRVVSEKLDYINRAGNASEILREVLGLSTTLPRWVEDDLESIVARYESRSLDNTALSELKAELRSAGLGELYPDAIAGLARRS